jgi:serine/threonine protein kinase/WD40 repeat protein
MGEVYRARDTRLDRTVAVKVLPSAMSSSPEVRQRFEREAKTISQLSHPHICALYDVGREGETEYLVMELLEGETLSDRLAKGALPLDQTLRYGQQIADALDKAHRQGIVHRDLKPGNVMLTKSGVKLLDFGLAKAIAPSATPSSLTSLPTQQGLTQEGTILGTFQYMAPEQLEGKDADARTDIFALGAVLYEMATGKKAFSGATQASLIGAILHTEPAPISSIQPLVPPGLDRVIKTCLAKDPEDRWQSARDVASELKWTGQSSEAAAPTASAARQRGGGWLAWAVAALAILLALVAVAAAILNARRASPLPLIRTSIVLPELSAPRAATLSPDGTKVVLVARDSSGRSILWIRSLDSLAAQPLSGTESSAFPFWSPDSRFVGFFADGKLKKIAVEGGPAQTLCDAPLSRGGSWGRDGTIVFSPVPDGPLYRVPASGGVAEAVTRFDPARGETSHRWPFFLPDGRRFLYLVASFGSGEERAKMGVYSGSLDSKEEKFILPAKSTMAYSPPGYLLFLRERTLMAQAFDEKSLTVRGDAFPVADRIQYFPQTANTLFSVSNTGLLLYQSGSSQVLAQLTWLDRSGREVGSLGVPADLANPRISPDGKRVAVDVIDHQTGNMDIWIYPSSGGVATRVTSDPAIDGAPVWSPDGDRIAFMSLRKGHPDVYLRNASGAGSEECILQSDRAKYTADWSPDGRFLLLRVIDAKSNLELWGLPVAGDRKPFPFLKAAFGVSHGQFSPDGHWVAYASNESGKWEVFVAPFPGPGGNWKVSAAGGSEPRWRRDGRELFYLAPDGKIMAVEVKTSPTFEAGTATPLFQTRRRVTVSSTDMFSYDVSADGQRFLVSTDVGEVTSSPLTMVLNWTAGLKK